MSKLRVCSWCYAQRRVKPSIDDCGGKLRAGISKSEANYSRGRAVRIAARRSTTPKAYCRYFIPPQPMSNLGQCEKVAGPINNVYWCGFARAHIM
jgi:hypothetical protein